MAPFPDPCHKKQKRANQSCVHRIIHVVEGMDFEFGVASDGWRSFGIKPCAQLVVSRVHSSHMSVVTVKCFFPVPFTINIHCSTLFVFAALPSTMVRNGHDGLMQAPKASSASEPQNPM